MYRNTANNIIFHYRTNSVKIKDYKFRKILFWPNFDTYSQCLRQKKFFEKKTGSFAHSVIGFLAPCQKLENSNNPVPRKHPDRGKDGQTLFCRTC